MADAAASKTLYSIAEMDVMHPRVTSVGHGRSRRSYICQKSQAPQDQTSSECTTVRFHITFISYIFLSLKQ